MTPDLGPVTDAVLAVMQAATGRPIGDGDAPGDITMPYGILYRLDGGRTDGSMGMPDSMADVPFQVTWVGEIRAQVDAAATRSRNAILERDGAGFVTAIEPEGVTVMARHFDGSSGPSAEGGVFNAFERFTLTVTLD